MSSNSGRTGKAPTRQQFWALSLRLAPHFLLIFFSLSPHLSLTLFYSLYQRNLPFPKPGRGVQRVGTTHQNTYTQYVISIGLPIEGQSNTRCSPLTACTGDRGLPGITKYNGQLATHASAETRMKGVLPAVSKRTSTSNPRVEVDG